MSLLAVYDGKRYGYAEPDGVIAVPPFLTKLPPWGQERFHDGLAVAYADKAWGFIERTGTWSIPPAYVSARPFHAGRAAVAVARKQGRKKKTRWCYVDTDGAAHGPEDGWFKVTDFGEGRAFVEVEPGDGAVLVDERLEPVGVAPFGGSNGELDVSALAGRFAEGKAAVRDANTRKWGYVDRDGAWVIEPRFEVASAFSEGLACVRTADNDVFFVDEAGEVRLRYPIRYLSVSSFSEGLVSMPDAEDSLARAYVDHDGEVRIAARRGQGLPFADGRALFEQGDGKRGYIDRDGKLVIEPTFHHAEGFRDGYARVIPDARKPGRYSWIDSSGQLLFAVDWRAES